MCRYAVSATFIVVALTVVGAGEDAATGPSAGPVGARAAPGPVAGSSQPSPRPGAKEIEELFAAENLAGLQGLQLPALGQLPLGERNRIALAAAKSIDTPKYIALTGGQPAHKFLGAIKDDSPTQAQARRQWGTHMRAAEILRHLATERLIDDPAVIPFLIAALDHPDRGFVRGNCFWALTELTRHYSGHEYCSRQVEDAKAHVEISKWWAQWWERNQKKHPVFDSALEAKTREKVLSLAQSIEKLKPDFPELSLFRMPKELQFRSQCRLFYLVAYDPAHLALTMDMANQVKTDRDSLPWIAITARFGTDDLPNPQPNEGNCPEKLKPLMKTCYSQQIEGTDVIIEVMAASSNQAFMAKLSSALGK